MDRKGGGLALIYRNNLKVSRCPVAAFRTFECAQWKVCIKSLIFYIIGIYRPPYSSVQPVTLAAFITEFTEFLNNITTGSESQVFLGDFNIHVDKSQDCYANQFQKCLKGSGLVQHVHFPTHTSGHTLDLIITKKDDKHLKIVDPFPDYYISDHCFVTCRIEQMRPPLVRKVITS